MLAAQASLRSAFARAWPSPSAPRSAIAGSRLASGTTFAAAVPCKPAAAPSQSLDKVIVIFQEVFAQNISPVRYSLRERSRAVVDVPSLSGFRSHQPTS